MPDSAPDCGTMSVCLSPDHPQSGRVDLTAVRREDIPMALFCAASETCWPPCEPAWFSGMKRFQE